MSDPGPSWPSCLNTGATLAFSQSDGSFPESTERWNIIMSVAIWVSTVLSMVLEMLSGPFALEALMFFKSFSVPGVVICSDGISLLAFFLTLQVKSRCMCPAEGRLT